MSEDKDGNAFFADGIHEDIFTSLQNVRELRVLSRQSVLQFRGSQKTVREIGRELGVAYLLEGSVRRAGSTVRVTGQLINASTEAHLWAEKYDRELTAANVFNIQSELSQAIVGALKAKLSPEEKKLLERRPTENLAAYDLFLQARDITNLGRVSGDQQVRRVTLLENAIKLDPKFATGWAWLSHAHAAIFTTTDRTAFRRDQSRKAIEAAVKLEPESFDVIRNLGFFLHACERDWARARAQYELARKLRPNESDVYFLFGNLERREGNWVASLANLRVALKLDPGNGQAERILCQTLVACRRYGEALRVQQYRADRQKENSTELLALAEIPFLATGSTKELDEFFAQLPPTRAATRAWIANRQWWARVKGDSEEWTRLNQEFVALSRPVGPRSTDAAYRGVALAILADHAAARALVEKFPPELQSKIEGDPSDPELWSHLGLIEAALGHKEDALRCARKATELLPESRDGWSGPAYSKALVLVHLLAGEKESALTEIARLLGVPSGLNVHAIRHDLFYRPLQGDPRFEALLNDPKNNAQLF